MRGSYANDRILRARGAGLTFENPTNHFDLLRSLEDAFGLDPLGYAARTEVTGLPLETVLKSGRPQR
ncbi:MAG: hypothetical protein AVDCRST_MAG53-2482 [uncultured Solirubrobacteraceae bacterium]|uniref:Uncharacterized protein n=1 Tax=uncultured Solirubrobacteraceae bacterium TaxID=1162706 RepID=A0A6J4SW09_9ACTN|nr:MAG: hypothetical protein AVDCRST_MAG53-2482 [uncultured Solirubrobacteraceae bacterium]